jgi:hypothetical protein
MTLLEFIFKLKFSDVISIIALIISGISIFWNIYRDIILKAKLYVRIQISEIIGQGIHQGPYIDVAGVNHGPGSIICEAIIMKNSLWERLKKKKKYGFIQNNILPKKLEVGERVNVLLPYNNNAFLSLKPCRVGIKDSFGRLHWAMRKSLKQAIKQYLKDFPI